MKRQITLREVAEAASVHPSTASRALNAQTRAMVNRDTVARVLAVASELGYQPNALARSLKVNETMTIGMLVPDLTNPLFPPIVRGIEDRLAEAGYTLLLANTDNDADKEHHILEVMVRRRIDGLVMATANRETGLPAFLRDATYPVVLVNRTLDDATLPSVAGDDHVGMGLAVRHLADLGHERIALICGPDSVSTGLNRRQAFVTWMKTLGLEPDLVETSTWFSSQHGADAFTRLLASGREFTAVITASDLLALGCYDAAAARGLHVPDDVSVVGYDDMPYTDRLDPPLTTVHIPLYEVGVRAAELVLDALARPDTPAVGIRLTPQLVVRRSTGAPRLVRTA